MGDCTLGSDQKSEAREVSRVILMDSSSKGV